MPVPFHSTMEAHEIAERHVEASSVCSGASLNRAKVPLRKCPAGAGLQVALEASGV